MKSLHLLKIIIISRLKIELKETIQPKMHKKNLLIVPVILYKTKISIIQKIQQ